ncbi:DUF1958 domain-containing protein [Enterococcus termitis]|uniref:D-alanyl-D-alanine carboxypeptidase n=1 Tax=Enterococcus termitis TaxID=332950 RepID=A0A1E5GVJ6_9ENTE|nr:DUF1958 domain-containing protein [Enterococcus termitis]OEG16708.1 D-alanyl-D-alanine carboxypeptidase [Enterococcus termitis]OJG99406.1 hypothetical protein RV18_GL001474 [Enterococcus termitis]
MPSLKKQLATLTFFLLITCLFIGSLPQKTDAVDVEPDFTQNPKYPIKNGYRPKASIVIDAGSGQILWEDQPDLPWSPASIAKVMTMYLVFEAMEQGKFTLDTTVKATEKYVNISQLYALSNNNISLGVEYPVRDLLTMLAVPSSNVATLMLANLVSDNDETGFIHLMNKKAADLGMKNTTYFNSSGAQISAFEGYYQAEGIDPNGDNKSTARDLAILAYNLVNKYPDALQFTNQPVVTTMKNTPYEETFDTYNYSLPGAKYGYDGVDGLKTGSSPTGGFNYIATAKKGEVRLIEVILGVGDWSDQEGEYERHIAGNAILDNTFSSYEYKKILEKGTNTINQKEITLDQDFYGLVKKGTTPRFITENGTLSLANELGQVSPKIPVQSINYQEKQQTAEKAATKKQEKQKTSSFVGPKKTRTYLFCGVLFTLSVLFFAFSRVFRKRISSIRRSNRKMATPTSRLFFILSILSFIGVIGVWFFL